MDVLWIAALAALWMVAGGIVVGLDRLGASRASRQADATQGARP